MVFVNGSQGTFLEIQTLTSKNVPTITSACFRKVVTGMKSVIDGNNVIYVVLEEVIYCVYVLKSTKPKCT